MSNSKINITESIRKGYLVKKRNWFDIVETIFCVFVLFWFPLLTLFPIFSIGIKSENDKAFSIIGFVLSLVSLFGCYRKLIENKLFKVNSKFSTNELKDSLIFFLEKEGLEIQRKSGSLVIAIESGSLTFNNNHIKVYTFIVQSNELYFTITRENFRLNFPVFFYPYILKRKLQKLLN